MESPRGLGPQRLGENAQVLEVLAEPGSVEVGVLGDALESTAMGARLCNRESLDGIAIESAPPRDVTELAELLLCRPAHALDGILGKNLELLLSPSGARPKSSGHCLADRCPPVTDQRLETRLNTLHRTGAQTNRLEEHLFHRLTIVLAPELDGIDRLGERKQKGWLAVGCSSSECEAETFSGDEK